MLNEPILIHAFRSVQQKVIADRLIVDVGKRGVGKLQGINTTPIARSFGSRLAVVDADGEVL